MLDTLDYYLVGDIAEIGGFSPATIRKWDRKGLIPSAQRIGTGRRRDRLYTREQANEILAFARERGLGNSTQEGDGVSAISANK